MTEAAAQTQTETTTTDSNEADAPESFDKWISAQPENIRKLFDNHVDVLKSTLDTERTNSKNLEKQLRAISKNAGNDTELKKQLDELADNAKQAESKATFYADAHDAGVKNLKLAWAAAQAFETYTRSGDVDFAKLKEAAPELFISATKTTVPPANAGAGAGQQGLTKPDMNAFMRGARR